MKLIDILAQEMSEWPDDTTAVVGQSSDGRLHLNAADAKNRGFSSAKYTLADNWRCGDVTRKEWQAAVDAMRAGSRCDHYWTADLPFCVKCGSDGSSDVVERTGEGLPPVGITIEAHGPFGSQWRKVEVLAHYKGFAVCGYEEDDGSVFVDNFPPIRIRPIRTPEQIEDEARESAIKDLMQVDDVYYQQAADIYDRGYRKFEIVEECGHTNEYNEGSALSCKSCGKG